MNNLADTSERKIIDAEDGETEYVYDADGRMRDSRGFAGAGIRGTRTDYDKIGK